MKISIIKNTLACLCFLFIAIHCEVGEKPKLLDSSKDIYGDGKFDSVSPVEEVCDTVVVAEYEYVDWRDSALTKLMKSEGFRSKPYKGLGGNMLIGYGCTYPRLWSKPTITKHQAKIVLNAKFEKYVKIAEQDGLRDNKAYSIADFVYNVGVTKYNKSTLRKLILNKASDELICKELMKWVHAKGVKYRGLVKRRAWECKMFSYKPKIV